jgi:citrate synthase
MPDKVLFEVTEAHLNTGLRGFPIGTCRTSAVDPIEGVHYVGYPVAELAYKDPEEIAYLVFHRELPNPEQLASFKADLNARGPVPPAVIDLLRTLPKEGHPMDWLISGIIFLGMYTKTDNWHEDALNVTARMPELVAAIYRLRSGWGEPIASRPELGMIENFVHMLGVPEGDTAVLVKLLRVFYVLHLDHGGGNLSTFVGKAVASGNADMYQSLAASMAALAGPLHGRANQDCLDFVREVGSSDPEVIRTFIQNKLDSGGKIYGFGHAVLRAEDPRAKVQYELGKELCPQDPLFLTALNMRTVAVDILSKIEKVSNPFPNVDAVSGSLLNACGLTDSNFYTVLFGLSRCTGIAAQIVEERVNLRGGKGVPIYRPKYIAEDQPRRHV